MRVFGSRSRSSQRCATWVSVKPIATSATALRIPVTEIVMPPSWKPVTGMRSQPKRSVEPTPHGAETRSAAIARMNTRVTPDSSTPTCSSVEVRTPSPSARFRPKRVSADSVVVNRSSTTVRSR